MDAISAELIAIVCVGVAIVVQSALMTRSIRSESHRRRPEEFAWRHDEGDTADSITDDDRPAR